MDSLCYDKQDFVFEYLYSLDQRPLDLKVTISLPFSSNVTLKEYSNYLVSKHNLSQYLEQDLMIKLQSFVQCKLNELQFKSLENTLKHKELFLQRSNLILGELKKRKFSLTKNDTEIKFNIETIHDASFYRMYHDVIHSGIITTQLMQLENHNSEVIKNLIYERNESSRKLAIEHNQHVESVLLSGAYTEREINAITKLNFENAEQNRKCWDARIADVREKQKLELFTWIMNTYEDLNSLGDQKDKRTSFSQNEITFDGLDQEEIEHRSSFDFVSELEEDVNMEESYTINLGSQLKTSHNLRLISANILKFVNNVCTTQRLQTAMSLYSNSLSAVILLVDKSMNNVQGIQAGTLIIALALF